MIINNMYRPNTNSYRLLDPVISCMVFFHCIYISNKYSVQSSTTHLILTHREVMKFRRLLILVVD